MDRRHRSAPAGRCWSSCDPASLHRLILSRIDQLTEDQKTLMKVASVIGRLFRAPILWGVDEPFDEQDRLRADL